MEKIQALKEQWATFKAENPKVRIRDAAKQLYSTEAELIATTVGNGAIRLKAEFKEILKAVASLGYVMALTRNDNCVHERKGVYNNVSFTGMMGLVLDPDIDLRLFMSQWRSGFAVNENDRKSLQFFGKDGAAIHKIYLTESSDEAAYETLVSNFRAEEQDAPLEIKATKTPAAEKPDADVDDAAFKAAWLSLKDTHDFHGLLHQYGLSRVQALRLAPEGHAIKTSTEALKAILHQASATDLEVMVFTSSAGCIQIHTGKVNKILQTGPWFNVLDPEFNMHLRDDKIDSVWLVKKPTADGIVTSIEVFDEQGNIIVQFFGKRKPGIPENENWRAIANEIAVPL
jgi:putative hemin transport protein